MKTKKFLAFALAAIMVLGASISVSAADITADGGSQNVTVSYGMNQSFIVTIPSSIDFATGIQTSTTVTASNVLIPAEYALKVAVSSNDYVDKWELVDTLEETNRIQYAIEVNPIWEKGEGKEFLASNGTVILTVNSGEAYNSEAYVELNLALLDTPTKSGSYTDTLTFSVSVDSTITFKADVMDAITGDSAGIYNLVEGMTWENWIDSKYNNGDFSVDGNGIVRYKGSQFVYEGESVFCVQDSNSIKKNVSYQVEYERE